MRSPEADELRRAMARLPTAVAVVGAIGPEGPLGATANAVTSLSLDPPLMLACLDRRSRTLAAIEAVRRFSINYLAAGQGDLARRFATKDPHREKWAAVAWERSAGSPRISGAVVWIGCELAAVHPGGDHVILIGEIVGLDDAGGAPLLFWGGSYRAIEPA